MQRKLLVLFSVCLITLLTQAQPKVLQATKTVQPPKIDGNLDDMAWQEAPVATDFIQNFPAYGFPASANTEVKILYDDNAVYIGAYMHDNPALIRRQLTERDSELNANVDYFSVFFDTYNDQQNGFQFSVTATNVQSDGKLTGLSYNANGDYTDKSWDAVWQSKTSIRSDGWVAEMRIPYLSLRFSKNDVQTWGLQFLRYIRRNSESSFWNTVNPNDNGFVNQFGKYGSLLHIDPPLRLSLSPYLSTGIRFVPNENANKGQWLRSGGLDIKYGINESFTLDASIIPDYGQVISDDVVTNLSPYETKFQDNRPFFTEGTELFNKAGLFYSRRIGATPSGYYPVKDLATHTTNYSIVENPSVTQLYNAFKFSGRTQHKLGIGVFNSITAPSYAHVYDNTTGKDSTIGTEPMANYNIIVLDQALKNRSYITFTNTNVIRKGTGRNANVTSIDFAFYDKTNTYSVSGASKYSAIMGYTPYNGSINLITDTISRNGSLYVKPYSGFNNRLKVGKVSGKVQYFLSGNVLSNTYDPNDIGYLATANKVTYTGNISYNQFNPIAHFINYNYSLNVNYIWLYKPYAFSNIDISANAFWLFKNMWNVSLTGGVYPYGQKDYFELRTPGRFLKLPWFYYSYLSGSSDSRKQLFVNYNLEYAKGLILNHPYSRADVALRYRFSNRFTLSMEVDRRHDQGQIGYAFLREANGDPIIGFRSYKDFTTLLDGNYGFAPRMNLSVRLRHYWSNVHYLSFHDVTADGNYTDRAFYPNQDQNFNAFNIDAFFTWDFRPGSRIVVGWKNWLGTDNIINAYTYKYYLNNFQHTFDLPHANELTLRFIYFLDYNQLRHKL